MKLQSIFIAMLVAGAPAAFSQQNAPADNPVHAVEAHLQSVSEEEQALSEDEKETIRRLEQIENDPVVRARAAAEAKVPLSVF